MNFHWLISVDDHILAPLRILEPLRVWVDRVPAKDRDRAPHMVNDDGMDYWVDDGKRYPGSGLSAVVGKTTEESTPRR